MYAEEAYKKNKETNGKMLALIDSDGINQLNSTPEKIIGNNLFIFEKLNNVNITGKRATGIIDIFKDNQEISIDKLAKYLNTTERTAGRILEKLESEGLVEYYIRKLSRGRPKKIYKFKEML